MRKQKIIVLLVCLGLSCFQKLYTQERFGAGMLIGTPTALAVQVRFPSANSIDVLFSSNLTEELFLQCHYDYRIAALKEDREGIYSISMYGGPGAFLKTSVQEKNSFGVSGNIGISWMFRNQYDFFLEYAPKITFTQPAAFMLTGGFGFRYVF